MSNKKRIGKLLGPGSSMKKNIKKAETTTSIFNYKEKQLFSSRNESSHSNELLKNMRKKEITLALAKHNSLMQFLKEDMKRDITPDTNRR